MATYFFILGIINSLMLIVVFIVRKNQLELIERYGWIYLLLAFPAIYGIILAQQQDAAVQYTIFLILFLTFLVIEALFDYVLKIDFRSSFKGKNLFVIIPYLMLYYAMNYGFVVMPWSESITWGITILALFVVQIIANIRSHP